MKCLNNIYPFIINNRILYLSFPEKSNIEYQFFPIKIREKEISENESVRNFWPRASIEVAQEKLFPIRTYNVSQYPLPSPLP